MERIRKILWPDPGPRQMGRWHEWLPIGFKNIGIKVEGEKRLHDKTEQFIHEKNEVRSVGTFEVVYEEGVQRVWYDVGCFVNHHGYEKLMSPEDIYFKIRMTPEHKKKYPRMFPIGNRATRPQEFLSLLPSIKKERANKIFKYDIIGILRLTKYEMRLEAVKIILDQPWKSIAWVTPHPGRPRPPSKYFKAQKYPYDQYLRMQAQTKLGFALPGVGDLTFRQMELMAMGRPCIITEPSLQPVAKSNDSYITIKNDLSDFIDKVNYYLIHEEEREEIGRKGMKFYNRYYSPEGQARYVLKTIEENS